MELVSVRERCAHAARIIRRGGTVAFPTETVYGLGADAFNPMAVARVFEIKGRPRFDPLIVHVSGERQAQSLVSDFPAEARALANRFWPGPLSLVLPKADIVPDIVTAGLPTVAVRMPDHPLALELLWEAGVPLAAPSANLFGRTSPTTAAHVTDQLADRVDKVLDGGPCRVGVESTSRVLCGANAGSIATRRNPDRGHRGSGRAAGGSSLCGSRSVVTRKIAAALRTLYAAGVVDRDSSPAGRQNASDC